MKKTMVLLLIIILIISCLLLNSCYPVASKKYFSIDEYSKIWSLTGFQPYHKYEKASTFFPDDLEKLNIIEFIGRYDEQLPLGEGIEIYLAVVYDSSAYKNEVNRISLISTESSGHFSLDKAVIYSTRMGNSEYSKAYEYAVAFEEKNEIVYIYLMHMPKDQIDFDIKYLPDIYEPY